jgi:FkbM family methyltransferase
MSYSQLGQDTEVLNVYNKKQNGFFVDIGAADGIDLSNTYLLETRYNWRGICVEPIPSSFELLKKNRPYSLCCDKAVYNQTGLTELFDISHVYSLLSGISKNIDRHKSTVDSSKTTITVKTISINDLLTMYNAPAFIEYLSLDTEGSEYEILKELDFSKYTFGLIDVEHNFTEPKRTHIKELLLSNGYLYKCENKFDDSYMHSSIKQ